jgi:putative sugar O-methyltransferase
LLELMLHDQASVPEAYKPTNYWLNYEKRLVPELRREGLRDFRRRKNSVLKSLGATDLKPASYYSPLSLRHYYCRLAYRSIYKSRYKAAKEFGNRNMAQPIDRLEATMVGSPKDVFSVDGKLYTTRLLYYYIHYAYCCKYVDFNTIDTIMELGAGSGKQIEVIKKLHPHTTFYVFDIAPQLYICQQYLSALFPDSVISYRQTRTMNELPEEHVGKILIFGSWKISELAGLSYDLFWNSASFQEMEPNIVSNYLKYTNQQTKRYVYLFELMKGMPRALKEGSHGVLEPTTFEHYKLGLKDFQLQDVSKANTIMLDDYIGDDYSFSFWRREQKVK